jgi:hypothetical protein
VLISDEIPQVEDWPGDPYSVAEIIRTWVGRYIAILEGLEDQNSATKFFRTPFLLHFNHQHADII